ncbi:MAG: sodium:alanine symporter family protein [Rhodothermales bacterium]|nr:sodium:alanine symporter family protein [Rhodothermales bacterium]
MERIESIINWLENLVWSTGIPVGGESIPFLVIALLGTGIYLTFRLGLIQVRRLGHGIAVTTGRYDDPNEPGDVSHFQALTTALSATVGIGNIAGVAIAIHWGGPGALFWMWMTALLGMAVKYSEVTLAQHFRDVRESKEGAKWEGTVSGGPMYYIEKGLGPKWKPLAMFFAGALMITAFFTGNAVQANTIADEIASNFGVAHWITGLITAGVVGVVILGGISRIGKVTGILAPAMALIYVSGAILILFANYTEVLPSFGLILREAFNPSAGVAGTGAGAFVLTLMWGVRRGLFSNEAGQGSAPIAHAAAKTDEPVSEGVVALLEPFIDTIVICTTTGLVILTTGVWTQTVPTALELSSGDVSYVEADQRNIFISAVPEGDIVVEDGMQTTDGPKFAWHDVAIERLYIDEEMNMPFTGTLSPDNSTATGADGSTYTVLHGEAVETGAPLTSLAFRQGLGNFGMGPVGRFIVLISVLLFGISTSISWSYYGDRCANYLWGPKAILPYKVVFVIMHFVGATTSLATIWILGDVALGAVTFPNLIALVLLSGVVVKLTKSYFERKPWLENAEVHKRIKAEKKKK